MTTIGTKRPEYLLCLHCKGTNRPTDHVRTSCAVCNTTEYDTVAENFQQNTHILLQFSVEYNSVVILLDNFRKLWYKKNCDNSDNNDYIPLRCNFSVYQKKCSPLSVISISNILLPEIHPKKINLSLPLRSVQCIRGCATCNATQQTLDNFNQY